jgi:hypothetical protein
MRVEYELLYKAYANSPAGMKIPNFVNYVNITKKQWVKYYQTGKLKVSPRTYKKLLVLQGNSLHKYTLLKIIDARK